MATKTSTTTHTEARGTPAGGTSAGVARALAAVRIVLGWVFLWAFLDKTFGLGFATPAGQGWIEGASPTTGFLASRQGTFGDLFQGMSGEVWADWMFMGGMAGLGIALTLGIALRLAATGGVLLMVSMWASMLPLEQNPVVDVHLFYAIAMIALAIAQAGDTWGLGARWKELALVQRLPILR
ncbi:DoxX family membrane protein [Glycomyces xiaoerkulensis]|uniref:DoxX family membrane protein n=1 Tax=Glycomyces xiaoerkulensis TaxID=2038139 RepID=UPI000DEEA12B|nr:DoxX family membrane protein [Glycomyces xiaoerkulensis]